MIIDDDADYRQVMVEMLAAEGWQAREAADGEQGLALARRLRPPLILCDLLMPACNGLQVCRSLRADAALRRTRVVVTSGRHYDTDRKAAAAAGADAYLAKPITQPELAEVLARLVPQTTGADAAAQPVGHPAERGFLRFWGVRGSIPAPGPATVRYGGNTSCLEVRADGQLIILDAGTGLRLLGRALTEEFKDRPLALTLLLTHAHWDHIQGLPFFQPLYQPQNRIRILGYEGARQGLAGILTNQMENPYFPIGLGELPSNVQIEELRELSFTLGSVRVEACFANHPGICVGFRLSTAGGSMAFFPDNEPHRRHTASRDDRAAGDTALRFARREDRKLADFLRDVDVLVLDAQYDCQEYPQHVGWGHGCVEDAVTLALEARAKQLFLFHHDPDHDDARIAAMVRRARKQVAAQKGRLRVDAAREGLVVNWTPISKRPPRPRKALSARSG